MTLDQWEGLEGCRGWKAGHEPTVCACSPEGMVPSKEEWPAGEGKGFSSSPPLSWDPTWSAVFSSGALITRKIQTCWSESIGGRKDSESAGAPLLLRQSERAGVIHAEKGRLLGNLIAAYQYFEGACEKEGEQLFAWADSNRIRGKHFKLREDSFRLEVRKFFTQSVVRHWTVCLFWVSHPWRCSRSGCTGPWAIWSNVWHPCPWQRIVTRTFLRFFPAETFLWFYVFLHIICVSKCNGMLARTFKSGSRSSFGSFLRSYDYGGSSTAEQDVSCFLDIVLYK